MANHASQDITGFLETSGIRYECIGQHQQITNVAPLDESGEGDLTWARETPEDLKQVTASAVILPFSEDLKDPGSGTLAIYVDNPRHVFAAVLESVFVDLCSRAKGFSDPAIFTERHWGWCGRNALVPECTKIGENVVIHPNVVIYPNVVIGDNVEIGAGCVLGAPGYGYVRGEDDRLTHFSHVGGVVIEDDVNLGANTCVDSGGLSPTRVRRGTKIGNFCQIAHNVDIGRDCLLAGRVQIGGGTKIGDRTEIWPSVVVSNKLKVGCDCQIKLGSVVVQNVPDKEAVSGNFAVRHDLSLREYARRRRGD
jgi:UDP-3-O-[3-hydroxymyristoyl] glucosamine N-acyltransferase